MLQTEWSKLKPDSGQFREIITKAVCGNIKKYFQVSKVINPPEGQQPSQILGFTVTKFQLTGKTGLRKAMENQESGINIGGTFETHIWYAYDEGKSTDVVKETVPLKEIIPITDFAGDETKPIDARVEIIKHPECLKAIITKDNKIKINLELGVLAEIISETRVRVRIYQPHEERH